MCAGVHIYKSCIIIGYKYKGPQKIHENAYYKEVHLDFKIFCTQINTF